MRHFSQFTLIQLIYQLKWSYLIPSEVKRDFQILAFHISLQRLSLFQKQPAPDLGSDPREYDPVSTTYAVVRT